MQQLLGMFGVEPELPPVPPVDTSVLIREMNKAQKSGDRERFLEMRQMIEGRSPNAQQQKTQRKNKTKNTNNKNKNKK